MSLPSPNHEAHPQSRAATERRAGFFIEPPAPEPAAGGAPVVLSLDAGPDSLTAACPGNRLWSIARDPFCLYFYWQLALPIHRFPGARLALAVHRDRLGGPHEATALLDHFKGTRFLAVSAADTLYHLALGFLPHGKRERGDMLFVAAEASVRTPRPLPVIPWKRATDANEERGLLGARAGRPPEVLALLFSIPAPGAASAAGTSGAFGSVPAGSPAGRDRFAASPTHSNRADLLPLGR